METIYSLYSILPNFKEIGGRNEVNALFIALWRDGFTPATNADFRSLRTDGFGCMLVLVDWLVGRWEMVNR